MEAAAWSTGVERGKVSLATAAWLPVFVREQPLVDRMDADGCCMPLSGPTDVECEMRFHVPFEL